MADFAQDPLEEILRQCATAAPQPWYPKTYAGLLGIERDSLDPHLEKLRLNGLIRLTDWVQGSGQGYVLTAQGKEMLRNRRELEQLLSGQQPTAAALEQQSAPYPPYGTSEPKPLKRERVERLRAALLGPMVPGMTYGLIAVNILVFGAGLYLAQQQGIPLEQVLAASHPDILSETGAVRAKDILQGGFEWIRLLTCCFVHIGFIHLAVNMYSLFVIGPLLERMWGHGRFLAIYLISGLGGSCAMLMENPLGGGAGASGALWGVLASMLVWVFFNRPYLPRSLASTWQRQLILVFILNIFITFGVSRISKGAHFGGGIIGLITAALMYWQMFGKGARSWLGLAGTIAIPFLCLGSFMYARTVDVRWQLLEADFYLRKAYDKQRSVETLMRRASVQKLLEGTAVSRRDPKAVSRAVEVLKESQSPLAEVQQWISRLGPYRNAVVENARTTFLIQIKAYQDLIVQARKVLEQKEPWPSQDEENWKKASQAQEQFQTAFLKMRELEDDIFPRTPKS